MFRTFGPPELPCIPYPRRCHGPGCFVPDGTCILDQLSYKIHNMEPCNILNWVPTLSPAVAEGTKPNGLKHLRPGQRPG